MPGWPVRYRRLEADCSALFAYDPRLVHGLVQGEEYARCALAADGERDADVLERRHDAWLHRKLDFFGRRGRGLTVVIGVEALDPGIGGPGVMRRQLAYLRSLAVPGDLDIRVLPPTAPSVGRYPAFALLHLANVRRPPVGFVEASEGATYRSGPRESAISREAVIALAAESVPVREYTARCPAARRSPALPGWSSSSGRRTGTPRTPTCSRRCSTSWC